MAENPFTNLSVVLSRTSKNFAPRKAIEETIRNKRLPKTQSTFQKSFQEWYTGKLNYQRETWNSLYSMAQLVSLFRRGEQLLVRRPFGQVGYYVRPIQNDDTYRQTAMNLMTFHSQISESKLMAVNPTVNMRPGDDTPEAIASAQACRPVVDHYETEWYTAKFTRREAIRLLTDGIFIHQVRWNPFKGALSVPSRQVKKIDQQVDAGEGSCADCSFEGAAEDFQQTDYGYQCPQCQSEATDVRPPETQTLSQISMGAPQPVGEPEIISSSLASWRWNLAVDLEKSSWAIKRQYVSQGAIKLMLGDVTIPDSGSSDDYGLDILHALTYSGQAFQGQSSSPQTGRDQSSTRPTMFEAWLSPEDQAEIECDEGETICGVTMPKGRISDFFKGQPVCVAGFNDGALILATYAGESHQQDVVTCQWYMDAESGAGRGMEDTAAVQRRFNAVDGQIYQGLATTATPPVFVDMRMLREDSGQYLFQPGKNHDVNLSMLPVGMRMQDAIYLPQPGQVSQQFMGYGTEFLGKNMANLSSLAVEFSDLLSIDNRTATGAQISAALANSLYGPMLMSKAESRVEIAKKIVCLQAKHGVASRFFPGKDGTRGREVSAQSLKGQVLFELIEGTHLPTTPYSQQSDVTALFQAFGGAQVALAVKQTDPKFFSQMTKPFTALKFDDESQDEISTLCLTRLTQMKEALESGIDDPNELVARINPPIALREPKHAEKQDWWSRWLDLDSAQKAPVVLRQAAEGVWNVHENLKTKAALPQAINQGLTAGLEQAAVAAPSAIGAQLLGGGESGPDQGADHAHEAEQATHDRELEAASQLNDQQHQIRLKEMEGETQKEVTRLQGENAAKSAEIAGKNAVKVAKSRPKTKNRAA